MCVALRGVQQTVKWGVQIRGIFFKIQHYRADNRNAMMRNFAVVDWPVIFGIVWTDVGQIAEGGDY